MRNVVRQLVQAGHRRIGSIRVFDGVFSSDQRLAGILDQLRLDGLPAEPEYHLTIRDVPLEEQGRERLRQLMKLPEPPTAIICIHDAIAANAIDELRKLGKLVPRDVSVFGFDDSFMARTLLLSSVRQPFTEVGKRAVRLLYEKRFGGDSVRHQESLPDREPQIGGRAGVIRHLSTAARSVPSTGRVRRLPPVSPVCRLRNRRTP